MVCYHGQDFGQAVEYQQKALAIAERVLGEDHPETAQYHVCHVWWYRTVAL